MNKKIVVIHQPDFVPYLGFFHRFLHADFYIALDHVQFVYGSRGWTHRDKIKTAQGGKWLTVSVKRTSQDTAINQIQISADTDWRQNNLNLLKQNYHKTPYYDDLMPKIMDLYTQPFHMLSDFNMASIEMLMDMLDVTIPWVLSSNLDPVGTKTDLLVDLLQKLSATHYLSGIGARDYFLPEPFYKAGIKVLWQKFTHPIYTQQFGEFVPYLSTLDLLFNHGITTSREVLRDGKYLY